MHELSLAAGICRTIVEQIGVRRLTVIRLDVGALSGVSPESLEFCLGEVARIEGLGAPRVEINRIRPRMRCACGREYEIDEVTDGCPDCHGFQRDVVAGMELTVTSVDVVEEGAFNGGQRPAGDRPAGPVEE